MVGNQQSVRLYSAILLMGVSLSPVCGLGTFTDSFAL